MQNSLISSSIESTLGNLQMGRKSSPGRIVLPRRFNEAILIDVRPARCGSNSNKIIIVIIGFNAARSVEPKHSVSKWGRRISKIFLQLHIVYKRRLFFDSTDYAAETAVYQEGTPIEALANSIVATYEEHVCQDGFCMVATYEEQECQDGLKPVTTRSSAGKKGDLGAITSKGGPPDHIRASEKELVVLKVPLEQKKSLFQRLERMLRRLRATMIREGC
ncbi:hypothetical protein Tco_1291511 [Tanacetum coccineum]